MLTRVFYLKDFQLNTGFWVPIISFLTPEGEREVRENLCMRDSVREKKQNKQKKRERQFVLRALLSMNRKKDRDSFLALLT